MENYSESSKPSWKANTMSNENDKDYVVGPGKPPRGTRFKKGQVANPNGRRGKPKEPEFDLGKVLQLVENEKILVKIDGKRKQMTKVEVHYVQLFTRSLKGENAASRIIADMAVSCFAAEAEEHPVTVFQVMPDGFFDWQKPVLDALGRRKKRFAPIETIYPMGKPPRGNQHHISAAAVFRKVAREKVIVEIDGKKKKITRWNAYILHLYNQALSKNSGASRLLAKLRKYFPGPPLPSGVIYRLMTESDARL